MKRKTQSNNNNNNTNNQKSANSSSSSSLSASSPHLNLKPSPNSMMQDNNNTNNNTNNSINIPPPLMNGSVPPSLSSDDPMLMMKMIQQCMQLNNSPTQTPVLPNNMQGVDPMMMVKMLQMFGGMQPTGGSNLLLAPLPPSSSGNNRNSNRSPSNTTPTSTNHRSPSPPPRPSSPTVIQQEQEDGTIPTDLLSQKYNLVEKKKRKMRCGKKRGPQEEFIFHLKLEQDKKKKRRGGLKAGATQPNGNHQIPASAAVTSSTQPSMVNPPPPSASTLPPLPPSSPDLKKAPSSSSSLGTTLKTKQRKTTKKIQEASARAKQSSDSLNEPQSSVPPSLTPSIPLIPTNFINNIPSDLTSLLMPKITPDPFQMNNLGQGNDLDFSAWQEVPQFAPIPQEVNNSAYPPLQTKPKGCFYGDKGKGKKVQKVPISQSSSRLQIINNRRKNSVISSIIDVLSDDTAIINHTMPSLVTLLDGFVVKVNESMKDMLGCNSVGDVEFQTMIQNFLHPQDIVKHDILLLQMLSTNSDSCKHTIRFVNRNGKSAPLNTEFCCIRNEMGLPQWIVIRVVNTSKMSSMMNLEELHTEVIPSHQLNNLRPNYDFNVISKESLLNDSPLNFQDMFLRILDRLFGAKQPTCFYDKNGTILWNNERFEQLFGASRRYFLGRRVQDISEMRGTIMEILTNTVLVDFPDKLEAQMSPDERSAHIYDRRLKMNCYGQKVTENNGIVFGYVWMFSVIRDEQVAESTADATSTANTDFITSPVSDNMFGNGDFFE